MVGPVWINLAPNLAKAAAAQGVEFAADCNDTHPQRY